MKMTMMVMTRGEGADEEEAGAGGVLRASSAGAKVQRVKMEMMMVKLERKVMLMA
jgi:hypothetical protein